MPPPPAAWGQVPENNKIGRRYRRWTVILARKGTIITLAVFLLFTLTLVDCAKKPAEPGLEVISAEPAAEPMVEEYKPEPAPAPAMEPAPAPASAPAFDTSNLSDVFFAYDRSDLTSDSRERLARNAKLLKAWKNVTILIEGHCDERGTNEYNLGLGERRANSAKSYLVSLGIPAASIRTISYGEERPFVMGHNEEAWKQNRRSHFTLP
jgi:peptidoglycan-associated lipoprotein